MTVISCDQCESVVTAVLTYFPARDTQPVELCHSCYEARMQAEADKADAALAGGAE